MRRPPPQKSRWARSLGLLHDHVRDHAKPPAVKTLRKVWYHLSDFATQRMFRDQPTRSCLRLFRPNHPVRRFAIRFVGGEFFPWRKQCFANLAALFVTQRPQLIETEPVLILFYLLDWVFTVAALVEVLLRLIARARCLVKNRMSRPSI